MRGLKVTEVVSGIQKISFIGNTPYKTSKKNLT